MPDSQILPSGIILNGANEVFTINTEGRYRISYHVNLTAALVMGTRILINGTNVVQSTVSSLIGLSSFSNEILIDISSGDTVSLQLFGLAGPAILLGDSVGASLMIMRLS